MKQTKPELYVNTCSNIKRWILNGRYHREDGPAIEKHNGTKFWLQHGRYHRVDGPAIEYSSGNKYWYLNGVAYTYEEWFNRLTPEQQYYYLWNLNND